MRIKDFTIRTRAVKVSFAEAYTTLFWIVATVHSVSVATMIILFMPHFASRGARTFKMIVTCFHTTLLLGSIPKVVALA